MHDAAKTTWKPVQHILLLPEILGKSGQYLTLNVFSVVILKRLVDKNFTQTFTFMAFMAKGSRKSFFGPVRMAWLPEKNNLRTL